MDQNAKIKREKIRTALATAIMIAAAVAVFVLLLYGLYKINMIKLPEPIEKLLGKAETEPPAIDFGGDEQRIYSALSAGDAQLEDYAVEYDVDHQVLLEALRDMDDAETFYLEAKLTYGDGQRALVRELKLLRDGEKYRAQIFDDSLPKPSLIVCDGEQIEFVDYAAGGREQRRLYPAGGDFSLEYQLGLPKLEEMLKEGGDRLKVSLLRTESDNLYFIECDYPDRDMREVVYVSMRYGCIFSAEIYRGDALVYSLSTIRFEANPAKKESDFIIER